MSYENPGKRLSMYKEGTNLLDEAPPVTYNCYLDHSRTITAGSIKELAKKISEDRKFKKFVKRTTKVGKLEIRILDGEGSSVVKDSEVLIDNLYDYYSSNTGKKKLLKFKSFLEKYTKN